MPEPITRANIQYGGEIVRLRLHQDDRGYYLTAGKATVKVDTHQRIRAVPEVESRSQASDWFWGIVGLYVDARVKAYGPAD